MPDVLNKPLDYWNKDWKYRIKPSLMPCLTSIRDNVRYWGKLCRILHFGHTVIVRGTYSFRLLVHYTKKAPQLSAQELVMFTKNMAAAATKCCPLSDEQQFVCMEDAVSTSVTSCLPVLEVLISNRQQAISCQDTCMTCSYSLIILSLNVYQLIKGYDKGQRWAARYRDS